MPNVNTIAGVVDDWCYGFLAINFFWGLYCVIMAFRRVRQLSFRNEEKQAEFLNDLMQRLQAGQYDAAAELAEDDDRALPQLAHVAIQYRGLGFEPMKQMVSEILQRDIMGELEYRTHWIATVIKSGPLLGLFGTVLGMMAAFGRIGTGVKVEQHTIADEIAVALICTAMGLATAIPFNFFLASINNRTRRLQESLGAGLVRVLDFFKNNPGR